ncbi:MAG: FG-GAP-like repeat-containing protein [Bacteroidota bacterium]
MKTALPHLYNSTLAKYRKFKRRLDKSLATGTFYRYSDKKRNLILSRLEKLKRRLANLQHQIKIAAAAGTLIFALHAAPVKAQVGLGPFVENPSDNPFFPGIRQYNHLDPALADIDNDGDLDLFIGDYDGRILMFENIGTATNPVFEQKDPENPLIPTVSGGYSTPTFADLDNDGDLDAFVGRRSDMSIVYFENSDSDNGTIGDDPTFTIVNSPNLLDGVEVDKYYGNPVFVDIDGDGDLDLFVGNEYGVSYNSTEALIFHVNSDSDDGTIGNNPSFTRVDLGANPLAQVNQGGFFQVAPSFADIDGDGDQDAFIGSTDGMIAFFENTGTATAPNFSEVTGPGSPVSDIDVFYDSSPAFADIDGDGDLDVFVGARFRIRFFENVGTANAGSFIQPTGIDNPLAGFDVEYDASPTFVDIDRDGDMDAVIGSKYGYGVQPILLFENVNGTFSEVTGRASPFDGLAGGEQRRSPDFADIDNDGDQDMFVGFNGFTYGVQLYSNDGSAGFPNFIEFNPILPLEVNYSQFAPTFADFDNDGDLDALVGAGNQGTFKFFENSDAANGTIGDDINFTELVSVDNPFDQFSVGSLGYNSFARPDAVDLDHDGDFDVAVGLGEEEFVSTPDPLRGTVSFFTNDNGTFSELTGSENALSVVQVSRNADPTFVDIDEDGDLDVFVGDGLGKISFYENQNAPPTLSTQIAEINFDQSDGPLIVAPDISINDDNLNMIGAVIGISENYFGGEDELLFSAQNGITGQFNSSDGVLVLSGFASVQNYQSALRSVAYMNSNASPIGGVRTISFYAIDNDATDPIIVGASPAEVDINVDEVNGLQIFNAVSPNGDDRNDFFEIRNLSSENMVRIYNRWGDLVYEIDGYDSNDPTRRFEGISNIGSNNELPAGTYFYQIESSRFGESEGFFVLKR